MDSRQVIITVVGLVATVGALIKAGSRLWDLRQDHQFAKLIIGPDQEERLEILMTKNLYRAQVIRVLTYLSIMVVFAIPFVFGAQAPGRVILLRTALILFVLFAFAAEEFYLDRARDRWLSSIRKARHEQFAIDKQGRFTDMAEENRVKMEEQVDLADSALVEQTNLTDSARDNQQALENQQRKRKRGS